MSKSRFKVFNLFKEKAPKAIQEKAVGILKWGARNNFPQETIQTIYNSPTASACMDTYIDFLEGDGITQEEIATFKVNKSQTLDELHSQISPDEGYLEGFAIVVKYNEFGEKIELKHLPLESVRLGIPDDFGFISKIYYNPFYGTNEWKEIETIVYDTYNPKKEVVLQQWAEQGSKYNGQVYYCATEKPLNRFYPLPYYQGGLKWFIIDHKIGMFHERNIDNNFLLSVLFKMVGDPDEALEHDKEGNVTKTVGQAFDEFMQNGFSGAENGGMSMALWSKLKEQMPEIQAFPSSTNHELFIALQQLTIDNISITTKVPPILANIQVAGKLGNSQEIVNSVKLMYQRVNKKQRKLERAYKELLTGFLNAPIVNELTIRNINPVDVIPPEVWASLTLSEQRKFIENNYDIELEETVVKEETTNAL
ncbi:MAG TPA: hypothetical protein VFF27_00225 [Bacteroidia bacterium]|nr:hypothetical protein [Bacteroidia bacterium]